MSQKGLMRALSSSSAKACTAHRTDLDVVNAAIVKSTDIPTMEHQPEDWEQFVSTKDDGFQIWLENMANEPAAAGAH